MRHGTSYVEGILSARRHRLVQSEEHTIRVEVIDVLLDLVLGDAVLENYDESCRSRGLVNIVCLLCNERDGCTWM